MGAIEQEICDTEQPKRDLNDELKLLERLPIKSPISSPNGSRLKANQRNARGTGGSRSRPSGMSILPRARIARGFEAVLANLRATCSKIEDIEFDLETERASDDEHEADRPEVKINRLESAHGEFTNRIEHYEGVIGKCDNLEDQCESIQEELTDFRKRVDCIEDSAVKSFNVTRHRS